MKYYNKNHKPTRKYEARSKYVPHLEEQLRKRKDQLEIIPTYDLIDEKLEALEGIH